MYFSLTFNGDALLKRKFFDTRKDRDLSNHDGVRHDRHIHLLTATKSSIDPLAKKAFGMEIWKYRRHYRNVT